MLTQVTSHGSRRLSSFYQPPPSIVTPLTLPAVLARIWPARPQRPQQALRLVQRLGVLALRRRVGDDAAADRELHPAFADRECPDQDVRVAAAVEAEVAEAAAVG